MGWRLAHSLTSLRGEVNFRWPGRSRASDGTLGDAAHASRTSDHNPNAAGVVRALDITAAGIDCPWYAQHVVNLGKSGHPALKNHGYVIWDRRAAYASSGWVWKPYTGTNPHTKHCHVSVGRDAAQYDSRQVWQLAIEAAQGGLIAGNHKLELTVGQYEEIMKALSGVKADIWYTRADLQRVAEAVHGTNDDNRDASIYFNTKYLRGELLGGENLARLRQILQHYGDPEVRQALEAADARAGVDVAAKE
jgi:hypothetical protein